MNFLSPSSLLPSSPTATTSSRSRIARDCVPSTLFLSSAGLYQASPQTDRLSLTRVRRAPSSSFVLLRRDTGLLPRHQRRVAHWAIYCEPGASHTQPTDLSSYRRSRVHRVTCSPYVPLSCTALLHGLPSAVPLPHQQASPSLMQQST